MPWRTREVRVFTLQRRLSHATTRGERQKARSLQPLLAASWSAQSLAVRRVTQEHTGKKTAGVEGVTRLTPPERLQLLAELDRHAPVKPVRRMWRPTPGTREARPLGMPLMPDRAAQGRATLALAPAWDARCAPHSVGCRPGRSCQEAIAQIGDIIKHTPREVLDADIARGGDRLDHQALVDKINPSPHVARPIREWRTAGVVDHGIGMPTEAGTPQGGVRSPL